MKNSYLYDANNITRQQTKKQRASSSTKPNRRRRYSRITYSSTPKLDDFVPKKNSMVRIDSKLDKLV